VVVVEGMRCDGSRRITVEIVIINEADIVLTTLK